MLNQPNALYFEVCHACPTALEFRFLSLSMPWASGSGAESLTQKHSFGLAQKHSHSRLYFWLSQFGGYGEANSRLGRSQPTDQPLIVGGEWPAQFGTMPEKA